ncbi:MAG: N-acetylmuramoyl-L-alanine amidase [Elainellaceae cyanobacterium]
MGIITLAIAVVVHSQSIASLKPDHPQPIDTPTALSPVRLSQSAPLTDELARIQGDSLNASADAQLANMPNYTPREDVIPADPTNYGPRYLTDVYGNPATNPLLVVIHETVGSADSAIRLFQTRHENDSDQVSYHSLIRRDGTIVHLVHPQMRAFGAGNSVFNGPNGPETVRTNPDFSPSVNNFAYHTSLETPSDGRGNQSGHSGYTDAQYQSLAWLVARLPVPDERITTHRAVDQSGRKRDPRSFNTQRFMNLLHAYPRVQANSPVGSSLAETR